MTEISLFSSLPSSPGVRFSSWGWEKGNVSFLCPFTSLMSTITKPGTKIWLKLGVIYGLAVKRQKRLPPSEYVVVRNFWEHPLRSRLLMFQRVSSNAAAALFMLKLLRQRTLDEEKSTKFSWDFSSKVESGYKMKEHFSGKLIMKNKTYLFF